MTTPPHPSIAVSDSEQTLRAARLMVVDDVPENLEMLTEALEMDGYFNIVATTNPVQALDLITAQPYDLVLLDMRMPQMDGHEFIRRARQIYTTDQLPILVLTAQTDDETRRGALAAGVRDFVTKPFVLWELLHRVRNAIQLQLQHNGVRALNEALETRVRQRTFELESTRKEVIRRLASAGEFRDNETGQHVVRMSHFAHHLCLAAGLSTAEAEMIRDAAPLHDIGKIGIPDAILLKRGSLEPAEWEIMKCHAAIGGEILARSGFALLEMARVIALTHHEKWDGTGYPNGLRGEAIPLAGRIVAIADVFDALTSSRPYKPIWDVERAAAFIRDAAGSHVDPALARLFQRELPALIAIRDRFRDADPAESGLSART
jgi:putative two-component system response regulator